MILTYAILRGEECKGALEIGIVLALMRVEELF
jgi:hypothetical protein